MHRWKTTETEMHALLSAMNDHMPLDVDPGTPVAAIGRQLVTDVNGSFAVTRASGGALHRYLAHPDGKIELSGWLHRQPLYHEIVAPLSYEQGGQAVQLVHCDRATAEELIARIAEQIPVGASLGRVRAVAAFAVLTDYGNGDAAAWGISNGQAWRQTDLSDGKHEIVTWEGGREVSRRIVSG
ncbi:hypothetical protein [Dactylosporangium sp. CA-092794]|uniref:hypothetical protein n=1 Tax=Dactylosporangium sp. CA-092794 TaxID=3239929 RepID=UPI003D8EBCC3